MPILEELKTGTSDLHRRIESAGPLQALRDGSCSVDTYRSLLNRFRGFYAPLEERLARQAWREVGLDFESRRKTPLLEADLRRLGVREWGPTCDALPDSSTLGAALGVLYVLEGSTLGGRLLLKAVRRDLGESPADFFTGYGPRTGPMWAELGRVISAYAGPEAPPERQREIVGAARETFERFHQWLSPEAAHATRH